MTELLASEVTLVATALLGLGFTMVAIFRDLALRRRDVRRSHYANGGIT